MTKEEYEFGLKDIKSQSEKSKNDLSIKYAMDNNSVKKGDVVEDHIGRIRVDLIGVSSTYGSTYPVCIYQGVELRKDLTPKLSGARRLVWQSNIKTF